MRLHSELITADNADVFAGTPLDQLEAGGQLDIVCVSATGADAEITVTGPDNEPIVQGFVIPVAANARASLTDDPAFSLAIRTGGHYTVNVNITAATTVAILGVYRKKGVDF